MLFSDIGGAAGLMLGMSFATFVGILDWFFSFTCNVFFARYRRIKKLGRRMSQHTFKKFDREKTTQYKSLPEGPIKTLEEVMPITVTSNLGFKRRRLETTTQSCQTTNLDMFHDAILPITDYIRQSTIDIVTSCSSMSIV